MRLAVGGSDRERYIRMLIDFVEIVGTAVYNDRTESIEDFYSLRKLYINPMHVACILQDENLNKKHSNIALIRDLDADTSFTRLKMNTGPDMSVVGSVEYVCDKINGVIR
jgi:hypothetical protein